MAANAASKAILASVVRYWAVAGQPPLTGFVHVHWLLARC